MEPDIRTRREIVASTVRRLAAYAPSLTFFGRGSGVARGFAEAIADAEYLGHRTYAALVRRFSALGATGTYLDEVLGELGVRRETTGVRAKVLVVFRPASTTVADVTTSGGDDYIEVEDATHFAAGAVLRIRSADGTTTETATVASVSVGTGAVNGWDELVITGGLSNAYSPTTESVTVTRRALVDAGTRLNSAAGVAFDTLGAIYTSDRNPVLDGESTALALADKVWAECVVPGDVGNVDPYAITEIATPIDGVTDVFNPAPAMGGASTESDELYRYRGVHDASAAGQETSAWLEALLRRANGDVARVVRTTSSEAGVMAVKVLGSAGTYSNARLEALEDYANQRVRSYMTVDVTNVTLTAVAVEVKGTLDPGTDIDTFWKAAAGRLATFLDWRAWEFGVDVDEAELLAVVQGTPGLASMETATFQPSSDVAVDDESLPVLASISFMDTATGNTRGADLSVLFG